MNEIEIINQRLMKNDDRFIVLTDSIADIATHLKNQDKTLDDMAIKINQVVTGTENVVSMWSAGVNAVRFFWIFFSEPSNILSG